MKPYCGILLLFWGLSACNRFETNHEQIPANVSQEKQDHTAVKQDTALIVHPDSIPSHEPINP